MWVQTVWIYQYGRRYWKAMVLYTLLGLMGTGISLISSLISKDLVDIITGHQTGQLLSTFAAMIGFSVANILVSQASSYASTFISLKVDTEIKNEIQCRHECQTVRLHRILQLLRMGHLPRLQQRCQLRNHDHVSFSDRCGEFSGQPRSIRHLPDDFRRTSDGHCGNAPGRNPSPSTRVLISKTDTVEQKANRNVRLFPDSFFRKTTEGQKYIRMK